MRKENKFYGNPAAHSGEFNFIENPHRYLGYVPATTKKDSASLTTLSLVAILREINLNFPLHNFMFHYFPFGLFSLREPWRRDEENDFRKNFMNLSFSRFIPFTYRLEFLRRNISRECERPIPRTFSKTKKEIQTTFPKLP